MQLTCFVLYIDCAQLLIFTLRLKCIRSERILSGQVIWVSISCQSIVATCRVGQAWPFEGCSIQVVIGLMNTGDGVLHSAINAQQSHL